MTESNILRWIKEHLSSYILQAIEGTVFTEDILAGMTMRETGFLIARYVGQGKTPEQIHLLMRGDYSQRPGESKKQYHGYGYIQIDTGSYPDFIKSGDWKDPQKSYNKAVSVLNEKRDELSNSGIDSLQAILAAYNCGSGNVKKAFRKGLNVDHYTHERNYSSEVLRYAEIYKSIN